MLTTLTGLAGCGLLCLAVAAAGFRVHALPTRARYAAMLIAAIAVLAPIGDLSVAAYVRGATGDLSVPTLALAGSACVSRLSGRRIQERQWRALLWAVAGAGAFLYPFALGFTPFDPYALGYGSFALVTVLLLLTLAAWRAGLDLVVFVVVAAALSYLAGIYESRNLWDYLVDPLVALYAVIRLGAAGAARWKPGYFSSVERARR